MASSAKRVISHKVNARSKEDALQKFRTSLTTYGYDPDTTEVTSGPNDMGRGSFEILYVRPERKTAASPNLQDCDGCEAFDADKGCAEGNMPGTCPEKPIRKIERHDDGKTEASAAQSTIPGGGPCEIETSKILITGWNPRKHFDEEKLQELAESIKAIGLIEPILVRPKGSRFELVVGERRLRAARMIKAEKIRAEVREMTDDEVLDAMIAENVCREDLNPIEEANHLKRVLEVGKLTQAELAIRIGKPQSWVSERIRLADAPADLQKAIICRQIFPTAAIEVLANKNAAFQTTIQDWLKAGKEVTRSDVRELGEMYAEPEAPACSESLIIDELPEDLKTWLKEGDVTLGAVWEIKPFAVFPPVYVELLRRCKEHAALTHKPIDQEMAKSLISGVIKCDYDGVRSLNLETPPRELQDRWSFFGKRECRSCPSVGHLIYPSENAGDREFCINQECFSGKLKRAQELLEAEQAMAKPVIIAEETSDAFKENQAEAVADTIAETYIDDDGVRQPIPEDPDEEPDCYMEYPQDPEVAAKKCAACPGGPELVELCRKETSPAKDEPGRVQKCHVLSCGNQTEPGKLWCSKHLAKEDRTDKFAGPHYNCNLVKRCKTIMCRPDGTDEVIEMLRHLCDRVLFDNPGESQTSHSDALHRVARSIREGGDTWGLLQKLFSKEGV